MHYVIIKVELINLIVHFFALLFVNLRRLSLFDRKSNIRALLVLAPNESVSDRLVLF